MPTYDYRCNGCGHAFEHFQSISDARLVKCPECGKKKLERLIGAGAGLIFKGSGFYITDYRPDSYAAAAKQDTAPTGDSSKSGAAKGDAKTGAEPSGAKPADTKAVPPKSAPTKAGDPTPSAPAAATNPTDGARSSGSGKPARSSPTRNRPSRH